MKKALFIDHSFHRNTRSADFFVDVVRQEFDVEVYYLTADGVADAGVLAAADAADVVLLWQMDFLAPVFRAMGKPTIVIPMYDGSAEMPDLHWVFASGARFLNFSQRLNERIRFLGGETMLVRYFPPAVAKNALPRFDRLKAFFWQRRPDHGVHFDYVATMIGGELDSFHLHNVPDVAGHFPPAIVTSAPYKFTESTWFEDKAEYEACLASCNVFIAPRASEGIGLALLEAMARGMLVLAHDAPTNNEYISNGINGILFNKDVRHGSVAIHADAQRLGRMAWRTVVDGHDKWLASRASILDWIMGAEAARPVEMDIDLFFRDLWYSYYGSKAEYEGVLRRHLGVLERLCIDPPAKMLDRVGGAVETRRLKGTRECLLDGSGLMDLTVEGDKFTGSGWSAAEPDGRWAIGTASELYFSGVDTIARTVDAFFIASSLPDLGESVRCKIALNGSPVFDGHVTPEWAQFEFRFAAELLTAENRFDLLFDKAMSLPNDGREMSVRFKSFQFSTDAEVALFSTRLPVEDAPPPPAIMPAVEAKPALGNSRRSRALRRILNRN